MPFDIPQFTLLCTHGDPNRHFCVGVRYKVDPMDKHKGEIASYWFEPMERRWVFIGFAPISFFNSEPIKAWIRKKKGLPEPVQQRVRQRPDAVPIQRQRVRERPVEQPVQRVRHRAQRPFDLLVPPIRQRTRT
jgi:hypothetical protein